MRNSIKKKISRLKTPTGHAPRIVAVTIVIIIAGSVTFSGCSEKTEEPVRGSGTIEVDEIQISSLIASRIKIIHVREGDRVKTGQPLVTLSADEVAADVAMSRAGVAAASQNSARALAALQNAAREKERAERLFKTGSISRQQLDRIVTGYDVARSTHAAARARAGQSRAMLARSRTRFGETDLTSPINGVVLRRNFNVGEVVMPGAPILIVADLTHPYLKVYVGESDLPRIRHGQSARVKADGLENALSARVAAIANQAEFTPKNVQTQDARTRLVFEIKLELENKDELLKPGMPADGEILPVRSESPPAKSENPQAKSENPLTGAKDPLKKGESHPAAAPSGQKQ